MESIFVSYNYNDAELVRSIKSLSTEIWSAHRYNFCFIDQDVSKSGFYAIDKLIFDNLSRSKIVLFMIGEDNHNSPWINREAELAISLNKKIIVMRLPGTFGAAPHKLRSQKFIEIPWGGRNLIDQIGKLVYEC